MKLATLKAGGRDGTLVVVSRDLTSCVKVPEVAVTMQQALDHWADTESKLNEVYQSLNNGDCAGAEPFQVNDCHSPLPRAYQWADGSAYINHVELVRKARGAQLPPSFYTDPLMYQGGSDSFIGPRDQVVANKEWGIDFEAEVTVVTDDVPLGASVEECAERIRLIMLVNDVSLRGLIPGELAKGFGFFQSKPASAFSPVAITPDELGDAWQDNKVHLPLTVYYNDKLFGRPEAGVDMTFDFAQLVAHVARSRELCAGSIIGSGTVSNKQGDLHGSSIENGGVGYCCLAEVRMYETIEQGQPATSFMGYGDRVRIEMLDRNGDSVFGTIENEVVEML